MMKRQKTHTSPLNPLEVTLAGEGGACSKVGRTKMSAHLIVCTSVIRRNNQNVDLQYWRTGSLLPTLAPSSFVQASPGTSAQLPATGQQLTS